MKRLSSFVVMAAAHAAIGTAPAHCAEPPPSSELQRQHLHPVLQSLLSQLASNMATIPAGKFLMGDAAETGEPDEKPVHEVSIGAFRMSKHEVTFAQYDAFAKATGKELPPDQGWGRGDRPVVHVSWDDAQEFIDWLNGHTGGKYRLPAEAEWEYAARAGSTSTYPWGRKFKRSLANTVDNVGAQDWWWTAPVGTFPANAFGLFDMIGNVSEWTQDCYVMRYLSSDEPVKHEGACVRVTRGGAWDSESKYATVSRRLWNTRASRSNSIGFRLAADP